MTNTYEYMHLETSWNMDDLMWRINTCATQGWELHSIFNAAGTGSRIIAVLERVVDDGTR